MSGEYFFVAALGALGIDAVSLVEVDLGGAMGVEGGVAISVMDAKVRARFIPKREKQGPGAPTGKPR